MTSRRFVCLVLRAWCELALYDVRHALGGFAAVVERVRTRPVTGTPAGDAERVLGEALLLASCLYWKHVLCLQRSACLVTLLRGRGIPARLVIGYRPVPFLSHAWVEVDGRVVNDSPAYQARLRVLYSA
jgi:hypothetical protein